MADKKYIVKVQTSLSSSDNIVRMLVYDETRLLSWEGKASKSLLELMKGEVKKFFHVEYVDTKIVIGDEAPWQNW